MSSPQASAMDCRCYGIHLKIQPSMREENGLSHLQLASCVSTMHHRGSFRPFCERCGSYKGLGPCENPDCVARTSEAQETRGGTRRGGSCRVCGSSALVFCSNCGNGFCVEHGRDASSSFMRFEQHIGRCSACGEYVCEECWLLNEEGAIVCRSRNHTGGVRRS